MVRLGARGRKRSLPHLEVSRSPSKYLPWSRPVASVDDRRFGRYRRLVQEPEFPRAAVQPHALASGQARHSRCTGSRRASNRQHSQRINGATSARIPDEKKPFGWTLRLPPGKRGGKPGRHFCRTQSPCERLSPHFRQRQAGAEHIILPPFLVRQTPLGRAPWWPVIPPVGPLRGCGRTRGQMPAAQGHIAGPRPEGARPFGPGLSRRRGAYLSPLGHLA